MSDITDQLLALAKYTGAPDVVEDAAHMLKALEGVRAERAVLQVIVDEQRAQIAKLVERIVELTEEVSSVTEDRRHAVAALSEQVDAVRAERDEARRASAAWEANLAEPQEIDPADLQALIDATWKDDRLTVRMSARDLWRMATDRRGREEE